MVVYLLLKSLLKTIQITAGIRLYIRLSIIHHYISGSYHSLPSSPRGQYPRNMHRHDLWNGYSLSMAPAHGLVRNDAVLVFVLEDFARAAEAK